MTKKRVLFIDDEPFFAEPYIRELARSFEVILEETAIGAIDSVNSVRTWDAIILDIMMPSPEGRQGATADGLDTGLWILSQIYDTAIAQNIPVIILTNRNLQRVMEVVDLLDCPEGLISVRPKIETPRFVLPHLVRSVVDRFRNSSED
jgi:CheY-like chemotaxis protein